MKEYHKLSHCVYYANYHIVFVTKYRRKIFKYGMGAYACQTLKKVQRNYIGTEILECNSDKDHIHILIRIPPKYPISEVVGFMKGYSAHAIRKRFNFLNKVYFGSDGIWSSGYFMSTVGIDEDTIRNYIEYQGKEDNGQAKLEL